MAADAAIPEVGHWCTHECRAEYRPQSVDNDNTNRTSDDALNTRADEDTSILKQNGDLGQAQAGLVNRDTGPECLKDVSGHNFSSLDVLTLFSSLNSCGDTVE